MLGWLSIFSLSLPSVHKLTVDLFHYFQWLKYNFFFGLCGFCLQLRKITEQFPINYDFYELFYSKHNFNLHSFLSCVFCVGLNKKNCTELILEMNTKKKQE